MTQRAAQLATDSLAAQGTVAARPPILEVRDLKKYFPITRGFLGKVVGQVKAVDGVSFKVPVGTTLGLVGESGCGKTTTSRCILRAIQPTGGQVIFHDEQLGPVDVVSAG
ncbi:MAG: hypothetical protein DCC57_25240, partial [Chloroflexi bacterium]